MKYLLLSDSFNSQSIAVIKFIENYELLKDLFTQALSEHFCSEIEVKQIILPKDGINGLVLYEDEFEEGLREVSVEQITLY